MPKVDPQAVLTAEAMTEVMDAARAQGPRTFALLAWIYEFGARAAEPGLQTLAQLDLRNMRAQPVHLKKGKHPSWHALLPFCQEALPAWMQVRPQHVTRPEHAPYVFPTAAAAGRCYTCKGTGNRPILKRQGKKRFHNGETQPCHHCDGGGARWGITRHEVYTIVHATLEAAACQYKHPHTLRHSLISHMLDANVSPVEVQNRVGHRNVNTTLAYARATPSYAEALRNNMSKVYGGRK